MQEYSGIMHSQYRLDLRDRKEGWTVIPMDILAAFGSPTHRTSIHIPVRRAA